MRYEYGKKVIGTYKVQEKEEIGVEGERGSIKDKFLLKKATVKPNSMENCKF